MYVNCRYNDVIRFVPRFFGVIEFVRDFGFWDWVTEPVWIPVAHPCRLILAVIVMTL